MKSKAIGLPLLFVVVGAGFAFYGNEMVNLARQSIDWPSTEGTVITSDTISRESSHQAYVRFEYEVEGKPYEASTISFDLETSGSNLREIQAIAARYPEGQGVTVFYDPQRPKTAVLERSVNPAPYNAPLIVGAGFCLLGIPLFLLGLVNKVRGLLAPGQE